jgi:uncharacterized hydrophobic protein (TIGR00341 family)
VRLVEITIPTGKRDAVLGVLEDEGIDYVLTEETSDREFTAVVTFPLPRRAVEPVLDRLREAGLPPNAYTVVLEAETVISRRFEELSERYEREDETGDLIARAELRTRAANLAPNIRTFTAMSVVSVLVATAGVLLDSAAVVVGSMVIAPVLGPAMATSVGTVVNDEDLFRQGVKYQIIGFSVAVFAATGFAILVKSLYLVPPGLDVLELGQVQGRLSPDFLSLAVALGGGIAGAMSLSGGISAALVGVMIAAALIPPVAAVAIGFAWGLPDIVLGAGVLVLVNLFSINLAALTVLWNMGYRPGQWFEADEARTKTLRRVGSLLLGLLLLSGFLAGVTFTSFQTATSDQAIRDEVNAALAEDEYANFTLIDVTVERSGGPVGSQADRVTVTVGRPVDERHPDLADRIRERVENRTGSEIDVQVHFVDIQNAGESPRTAASREGPDELRHPRAATGHPAVPAAAARDAAPS